MHFQLLYWLDQLHLVLVSTFSLLHLLYSHLLLQRFEDLILRLFLQHYLYPDFVHLGFDSLLESLVMHLHLFVPRLFDQVHFLELLYLHLLECHLHFLWVSDYLQHQFLILSIIHHLHPLLFLDHHYHLILHQNYSFMKPLYLDVRLLFHFK